VCGSVKSYKTTVYYHYFCAMDQFPPPNYNLSHIFPSTIQNGTKVTTHSLFLHILFLVYKKYDNSRCLGGELKRELRQLSVSYLWYPLRCRIVWTRYTF
jgi:hypothetical protein